MKSLSLALLAALLAAGCGKGEGDWCAKRGLERLPDRQSRCVDPRTRQEYVVPGATR